MGNFFQGTKVVDDVLVKLSTFKINFGFSKKVFSFQELPDKF